jgi:AcrR family transcriptional regulator
VARDTEILNAAADLFRKRGFAAVGVDEIGRTAGVTGPAIYRHFKGKDDILGVLFDEGMDEITSVTSTTFDDPHAELRYLAFQHGAHVMHNPRLASIWLKEGRSLAEPHRRRYLRRANKYIERWTELLERCYPNSTTERREVATRSAIGALNAVDDWPRAMRSDEHLEWLVEMVVAGLAKILL